MEHVLASQREVGGVALAFAGFAFLVLSFKGTWHNVYLAAMGKSSGASSSSSSSSTTTPAAGMPGGAPAPTTPPKPGSGK